MTKAAEPKATPAVKKYGTKESHNPILAIQMVEENQRLDDASSEGGCTVTGNVARLTLTPVGHTKADCDKWMKKTETKGKVLFARFVTEMDGGPVSIYKVKEVTTKWTKKEKPFTPNSTD